MCAVYDSLFSSWLFSSINFLLRSLIDYPSAMNKVSSTISRTKTIWHGVDCSVLWNVLRTANTIAANIPDQGLSSSR